MMTFTIARKKIKKRYKINWLEGVRKKRNAKILYKRLTKKKAPRLKKEELK